MTVETLKPCPFCGGKHARVSEWVGTVLNKPWIGRTLAVYCLSCFSSGPVTWWGADHKRNKTKDDAIIEAIGKWNDSGY